MNEKYFASLNIVPADKPLPYFLKPEDMRRTYSAEGITQGGIPIEECDEFLGNALKELSHFLNDPNQLSRETRQATINEEQFVRQWLPFFYGEPLPEGYEQLDKYSMADMHLDSVNKAWIRDVSGSAQSPVYVLRNGEVIYVIPPMMDQLAAISGADRNMSIGETFREASLMKQRIPSRSVQMVQDRRIVDAMGDFKEDRQGLITNKVNYKYLFVMDEIFTYYGYPSILTPEIMSIKSTIMKGEPHGDQSSGTIPESGRQSNQDQLEDDDLFDE